jgi:DNA-binding MarR family transcriptional regulator
MPTDSLQHQGTDLPTGATVPGSGPTPVATVASPARLERALTEVARAILRLEVPRHVLAEGESIDRSGYWLLVRMSEDGPLRASDLADSVELDVSTVSRQVRNLAESGLITKVPDPQDGRASILALSERGAAVLEAVSEARQHALDEGMTGWTDDERTALTRGLLRLADGLHPMQKGSR